MSQENTLKEFVIRENRSKLYSYEIDGVKLYPLIRRDIRDIYLRNKGFDQMYTSLGINYKAASLTLIISLMQFIKLFLSRNKIKKAIHSFPRVERVGDFYIDKFTEPVCKLTKLADNALIFCKSFGGVRREPRLFSKKIIYTDIIDFFQRVGAKWRLFTINKSDRHILDELSREIYDVSENTNIDYKYFRFFLMHRLYSVKLYTKIYTHLGVKKVYLVSRIPTCVYAAHKVGATVYEFQHGITYGETNLYSGKRLPEYTPDFFLAFSNTKPRNVYGIKEDRIINIGWAFGEYIKKEKVLLDITDKDVLVICDPTITDVLIKIIIKFAKNRNDIRFHLRPHPNQRMTIKQLELINEHPNLYLQDNSINSNVVLNNFTHIIGENSTVLYEAVSMGKKVGKLFFPGLNPKYLVESDKSFFFKIASTADFDFYLNSQNKNISGFSIYEPFNMNYSYIFE